MPSTLFLVTLILAIVVITAGVTFLVETIVTRDVGAGRYWSYAFVLAMLTTICYLAWAMLPQPFVAVSLGNGAYIAGAGFMWIGCRAFNRRASAVPIVVVLITSVACVILVLASGVDGGDYAGGWVYFPAIAAFAGLASAETLRVPLRRDPMSLALTILFAIESLFFAVRGVALIVLPVTSSTNAVWLGSIANGLLTIVLSIVTVVVVSTMRTRFLGGSSAGAAPAAAGVIPEAEFRATVQVILARAEGTADHIGVAVVRLDDIGQIGTAFGYDEEEALRLAWRAAVRDRIPTWGVVGESGPHALVAAFPAASALEARRAAGRVHHHVLDVFAEGSLSVVPVIGVGVALTETTGWDLDTLWDAADAAARHSATSPDASVIVAPH